MGDIGAIVSAVAGVTTSAAGTIAESQAIRAQADVEKKLLRAQAREVRSAAQEEIRQGKTQQLRELQRTRQLTGAQRVAAAGQGIDITSGSIRDIITETRNLGGFEALQLRTNAFREALGLQQQAIGLRTQARLAGIAGRFKEQSTLLTGGLQAVRGILPLFQQKPPTERQKKIARGAGAGAALGFTAGPFGAVVGAASGATRATRAR